MSKGHYVLTGDVGPRDQIIEQLGDMDYSVDHTIRKSTKFVVAGKDAKEPQLSMAKLYCVPIITPKEMAFHLASGKDLEVVIIRTITDSPSSLIRSSSENGGISIRSSRLSLSAASPSSSPSKAIPHGELLRNIKSKKRTRDSSSPASNSKAYFSKKHSNHSSASMEIDSTPPLPNTPVEEIEDLKVELPKAPKAKRPKLADLDSKNSMSSNNGNGGSSSSNNLQNSRSLSSRNASTGKVSTINPNKHDSSHMSYVSPNPPGSVIALEGLIGIGKSTLCGKLTALFPNEVDVYREETNEQFLQLFYSDPKRYGFALQWGMLKSRVYQLRLAQHDTKHGRWPHRELFFWDRSMIGDYIFALWNHLLGGISTQEMDAYESEFGGSIRDLSQIAFLRDIQLFVLMNDEPSRCKMRVEVNRKNASEQGIPLGYYDGLDDMHFHMFLELLRKGISKVIVQPWGEYDDPTGCRTLYEEVLKGERECPKILDMAPGINVASRSKQKRSKSSLIYASIDEVNQHYDIISDSTQDSQHLTHYEEVYIPRDICIVDPATKSVNQEHLSNYNIKFYTNAYKRVVLFHLGNFQTVHFYDSM